MTTLPDGWRGVTPHEIAGGDKHRLGIGPFGSNLKTSDYEEAGIPLVFVRDIRTADFSHPRQFVSSRKAVELSPHVALPGDVLITKMGDPPGDAAVYTGSGPAVITADCIRLRPTSEFLAPFIAYAFDAPPVRAQFGAITRGVAQQKVSLARFRTGIVIPVPPLDEQRRIVDILEDHLSRLDDAASILDVSFRRSRALDKSVLVNLIPDASSYPQHWQSASVADAGLVELGRQRHPDWHTGDNMRPYLRVANVFEDRIDTRDVMEMHWPGDSFERFRLKPGDVLLNEGQSPEWLGRPALYRGTPEDVAFTNSLIRFRARGDVLPEFALIVFRRHMHAGRFMRESRITTNIAHLSAARLKAVEFPIPPLPEQAQIVARASERLGAVEQIRAEIGSAKGRSSSLRRALLAAAFSGRLTGRSSDLDIAEELMPA